ncbi:hypothetical protein LTR85_011625 [Meristemomyces frigidus]|nr:hypothetical protein LTR85_011625 [Meristemomyces frigidus]
MSRILPLPPDATSQIHSSKHITCLQGVVLALLENSLDAGATKVGITVDFQRADCIVEDNGCGIPPAEFVEDGGLGRMYHTSKRGENGELHGSTGTYLASLAALSLLAITSRHGRREEHATVTLHHGKVAARQVPAPSGHDLVMSDSHGTRVTVRDLFGNMPVRVKQRALLGNVGTEDEKAWQELKRGVVALMLAWPKPCAVKLRDGHANNKLLKLSTSHPSVSAALTERSLNQLGGAKIKFELRDALPLVFQAGLAPAECRQSWVPVSTSTLSVAIKGAVCLEPMPTKQCQFISIGIRPCSSRTGHNELFDTVNRVFANSSFGAQDDVAAIDEAEKDRRERDRRYKNDGYTQKQLQGRKGVDRWPMFVLQIKLKDQQQCRPMTDSSTDAYLKTLVDILEATVTQWLATNNFRPQQRRRRKNEQQQGPTFASSSPSRASSAARASNDALEAASLPGCVPKRPMTIGSANCSKKRKILDVSGRPVTRGDHPVHHSPSSYFNTLGRIKSGKGTFYDDIRECSKPATAPAGRHGSMQSPLPKPSRVVFRLPVLEAGELSASRPVPSRVEEIGNAICPTSSASGNAQSSSDDFGSVDDAAMLIAVEGAEPGPLAIGLSSISDGSARAEVPDDSFIDWTDPVTRQLFQVNARTGVVLPFKPRAASTVSQSAHASHIFRNRAAINTSISSAGKPLSLARRSTTPSSRTDSGWLPGFLKDWNNPVFQRQDEERIPVASFDGPGVDITDACKHRCSDHSLTQHFAEAGVSGTSKLSKAALLHANVIKQVDAKFILCKLPSSASRANLSTLVLVDQHAASERVILEGLLAELCASANQGEPAGAFASNTGCKAVVNAILLERPLRFHISAAESELLAKYATHFARWGILYDLTHGASTVLASQVRPPADEHKTIVRTLPPGIAERCSLFPNLLIELLRSEVWSLAEATSRPRAATYAPRPIVDAGEGVELDWLRQIGSCPKGIIDMLNSRACRSAIMFNDVLSVDQCERLLADLGKCAFPFMCAHGRVSMVPLVELGEDGMSDAGGFGLAAGATDGHHQSQAGFVASFGLWQRAGSSVNKDSDS